MRYSMPGLAMRASQDPLCLAIQAVLVARTLGREGAWSIRINDQWRLCFRFEDGNAYDAEIVDYH
jgi:plasmid maintenance system killer protein